jgi:pimeloyl-ACP methyl ester carboxylesterase
VLVHGVAGSHRIWDLLVPYLEPHYSVVRFDLMGYGSSPMMATACTPDAHVEAIRDSLGHARISPPHALIGLSMGANLVLTYAARWPDEIRDLVGIGLPYYASEEEARIGLHHNLWTRLTLEHPRIAAATLPACWWVLRHSGLTRWHRGMYTSAMAHDALRVDYSAFRSSVLSCMLRFPSGTSLTKSATMRRLFIHGSEDQWSSADAVRPSLESFPATRFDVIEGAPHNVVVAFPAETAQILLDYLAATGETTDRVTHPTQPSRTF